MINNYEIRKENNEEILYIFLDFNDEFARLNIKERSENLEKMIKKYIEDNQIDFKGIKVALIVGGIAIGTLLLGQPSIANSLENRDNNDIAITDTIKDSTIIEDNIEIIEVPSEKVEDSDIIEQENKTHVSESIEQEVTNQSVQNIPQEPVEIIPPQVDESNNTVIENNTEVIEKVEEMEQPVEETKTYVTIHRTNGTIITLELEEYIIGVVGAEMPAAFHEQALMSQAVIARTYALKAIERNIVLTDNSSTQNYKSNEELRSSWGSDYNYYYNKIQSAVQKTKGMYLTYNGTLIDAVYHSTSNGTTEDSKYVWGNAFPYLVSVESPYDSTNPTFQSEKFITYEDLSSKLQTSITSETTFHIFSYTSGNRIENIEINGTNYTGVKVRNLLGLRSADFDIQKSDTGIIFITKGYGHGVGLSQYGANGMAKNGYTYTQILKHYYQGVTISHL